jgi:hypothetical protein
MNPLGGTGVETPYSQLNERNQPQFLEMVYQNRTRYRTRYLLRYRMRYYPVINVFVCSGGLFHFSTKGTTYGLDRPDHILYKKEDCNPVINEFGIYIIDRLCTFQNTQHFTVTPVSRDRP